MDALLFPCLLSSRSLACIVPCFFSSFTCYPSQVVTLQYGFVPLVAARFVSLHAKGGADDLFSSDFSDAELRER